VRAAIIADAEAVARRLGRDAVRARTVVLKVKLADRLGRGKFRGRVTAGGRRWTVARLAGSRGRRLA